MGSESSKITRRRALAVTLGVAGVGAAGCARIWGTPRAGRAPKNEQMPGRTSAMAKKTWTLTDADRDLFVEEIRLTPDDVKGAATGYSVSKRTLRGGLRDGVDVIEVDNGAFRFVVVPTRGMGIWHAFHGDFRFGWHSPVNGPVHPSMVRLDDPSGLGWLDGFDEMLVRCGLEYNGGPEFNDNGTLRYGLHGKIANIPAHRVEVSIDGQSGEIDVAGVVDEARLFGNKLRLAATVSTRLGQPGLTITDTVTNISAEPSELQLIYHTNFGPPLLDPGSKVVLPVKRLAAYDKVALKNLPKWDTFGPQTPGAPEACFLLELAARANGQTQAVLRNKAANRGVSYKFSKEQLPWFTIWKNRQAKADGYVIGLEPGTNLPNTKSFEKEKGRVAVLAPGQSRAFELALDFLPDAGAVAAAEKSVAALRRGATPQIFQKLMPDWSAG
jgi:galactose mutarotase-like enzyme